MIFSEKILKIAISLLLVVPPGLSAQNSGKLLPESDSVKAGETKSPHALYSGGGYGSNMIYLGSTISQDHPYGYGSVSYGYRNQLFASVSAVHLSGTDPFHGLLYRVIELQPSI